MRSLMRYIKKDIENNQGAYVAGAVGAIVGGSLASGYVEEDEWVVKAAIVGFISTVSSAFPHLFYRLRAVNTVVPDIPEVSDDIVGSGDRDLDSKEVVLDEIDLEMKGDEVPMEGGHWVERIDDVGVGAAAPSIS